MKPINRMVFTIFISVIGIFLTNSVINAGYTVVGESGVSQNVINAIIGTEACIIGYIILIYLITKSILMCVGLFKNYKSKEV